VKSANVCSLVLVGLFISALDPTAAESPTPVSRTGYSPRSTFPSVTGAEGTVICNSVSTASNAEGGDIDQSGLNTLNLLGIQYAKGQGVKKNSGLAMRFFLRSAMQGYTPAMVNLGILYETGAVAHPNFQRAYAWMRTALLFGVPEEDHDATALKLGMIAARLGPNDIDRAETLAAAIATRILDTCQCSPGEETELALNVAL
jgi:TPR repeat protein